MKRNVDLTENRFFSSDRWFTDIAQSVLTIGLITRSKFPWNAYLKQIHSDDELCEERQRKAIIVVGDKKTRAKVKEYRQMDSQEYCDCCGKRLNLKPWDLEIGVCHKCLKYCQTFTDKCTWRDREPIRNAIIRTS